jgi:hypothetical protein
MSFGKIHPISCLVIGRIRKGIMGDTGKVMARKFCWASSSSHLYDWPTYFGKWSPILGVQAVNQLGIG